MKLRHFNPMRHARLEREVAALNAASIRLRAEVSRLSNATEHLRSGVVNYIDMVGRQVPPDSAAGVLRRAILAENEVTVVRQLARTALYEMNRGNHHFAAEDLRIITGDEPAKAAPLHVVDVVA